MQSLATLFELKFSKMISIKSILTLRSRTHLDIPSGPFPLAFPTPVLYEFLFLRFAC